MVDFMFYTHKRAYRFDTWMHRVDHYVGNAVATVLPQFAMGIVAVAQPHLREPVSPMIQAAIDPLC